MFETVSLAISAIKMFFVGMECLCYIHVSVRESRSGGAPSRGGYGRANAAVAEAGEGMARTVSMAAKMLMGFREDMVLEVVPELEVKKVPKTEVLGHPTV